MSTSQRFLVDNLSGHVTDQDLRNLFSRFGTVQSVQIIKTCESICSISSPFAIVKLENLLDFDVIKWSDGSIVNDQVIRVQRCYGDRDRVGSENERPATEPVQQVKEHS